MHRILFVVISLLLLPDAAWAKASIIVLGRGGSTANDIAMEEAEHQLRRLDKWQVLPPPAVKMKLRAKGITIRPGYSLTEAGDAARAVESDYLLWVDGWDEKRTHFAVVFVDLRRDELSSRRAAGVLHLESDFLRSMFVKGVVTTAAMGRTLAPPAESYTPPKIAGKTDWGIWSRSKTTPDFNVASLLIAVDEKGKVRDAFLLETSWPNYGKRALEVIGKYKFDAAQRDGEACCAYGLINTYSKNSRKKGQPRVGANQIWASVFLETLAE
ncbi:MAG: hypothetical protein P9L99_08575 [Candidatus Lernaella stagnicola]|nr:hypothetical protein [Candidatus Lernaella stagnicola]